MGCSLCHESSAGEIDIAANKQWSRALIARTVDGDPIDVNLVAVDSVGQAKLHIGEALGESPEVIFVLDGKGTQLGDGRPLSTVTKRAACDGNRQPHPGRKEC